MNKLMSFGLTSVLSISFFLGAATYASPGAGKLANLLAMISLVAMFLI